MSQLDEQSTEVPSRYLRLLPAIYARAQPGEDQPFLGQYLKVPEALLGPLDGTAAGVQAGMAALLDALPALLTPRMSPLFPLETAPLPLFSAQMRGDPDDQRTTAHLKALNHLVGVIPLAQEGTAADLGWSAPIVDWLQSFLDWLSGWLAFTPRPGWNVDQKRQALLLLMRLYRQRGTAAGLQGLLGLCFPQRIQVVNLAEAPAMILGQTAVLADPYVEGGPVLGGCRPFNFAVDIYLPTYDFTGADTVALVDDVRSVVDAEAPVHVQYTVRLKTLTFQIGVSSTLGVDTLLPIEN